jgi:hypothetical protein
MYDRVGVLTFHHFSQLLLLINNSGLREGGREGGGEGGREEREGYK